MTARPTAAWDPGHYLAYADERARPFLDLLGRIDPARQDPVLEGPVLDGAGPTRVVDLGCGPGTLTVLLARRWPGAEVLGVDDSEAMITACATLDDADRLRFECADLRAHLAAVAAGERPRAGVVVSNATLQWLPDHLALLPALVDAVVPGGWLGFQVPGNFGEPSHVLRAELAADPAYASHLAGVAVPASHEPAVYLEALVAAGLGEVDVWETTYLHRLHGADAVFDWVSSTGARPTLAALPPGLREEFEAEYRARLRAAYPASGPDAVVVLPFRRIFAVGRRA
ncbi:methyltransferase domain-containing protein [Nocardioides sp.]|uniref:methyltransferase domain-containing protein n=1 Tax=Nocardioides sp. TaxID=35761 RepID=UPI0035163D18